MAARKSQADIGLDRRWRCANLPRKDVARPGPREASSREDTHECGPPGEHDRFVRSVTNGKNQMPPWGDLLKGDDIEAVWAYVTMGEKR